MIKPILIPTDKEGSCCIRHDKPHILLDRKNVISPAILTTHNHYDIILIDTEAEIVEGDWVVNTDNTKNKPNKVSSLDNGTLGVKLTGWFEWRPLSKSYKKIISSTNKSHNLPQLSPQSIQLLIKHYNEHGCMLESVEVEEEFKYSNTGKRDDGIGKYIIKLNQQGEVDITIPEVKEKLYTEEEVRRLLNKSHYDRCGNPYIVNSKLGITDEWFNSNKK